MQRIQDTIDKASDDKYGTSKVYVEVDDALGTHMRGGICFAPEAGGGDDGREAMGMGPVGDDAMDIDMDD